MVVNLTDRGVDRPTVGVEGRASGLARSCAAVVEGGLMKRTVLFALVVLVAVIVPFAVWRHHAHRDADV